MNAPDDIAVLVAARDDPTLSWTPSIDLARAAVAKVQRRRQHRRRTWVAAAAAVAVGGAVAVLAALNHSDSRPARDRLGTAPAPVTPNSADRAVDFSVGYMPAGYRYFNTEHAPASVAADITRRYALDGDPQRGVILVEAQYGLVMSFADYRRYNGPLRDTRVNGHPALIGWNTGHVGQGLHLLYVRVDANTSLEVSENPAIRGTPLSDSELERVAAGVTVLSSGPATSTITIPDVVGLSQQAAADALEAAGTGVPVVEDQYGTTVPRDHVISQSPAAGTQAPQGATVTLKVAG
jgi:hypothetical protein